MCECKFPFALKWYSQSCGLAAGAEHSFAHLQISHMGRSVRSPLIRKHAAESKPSAEITQNSLMDEKERHNHEGFFF